MTSLFVTGGPIILEAGNTSTILYNLLGPKVGKLVKIKIPSSTAPSSGAMTIIFTMLHLNIPPKIPNMFQVCRLSGSKNWNFFKLPTKKLFTKNPFFEGTPLILTTWSAGVPNATHQIWKWSTKPFWRRSFFYHFQQNAPLLAPGAEQRPDFNNLQSNSCPNALHQISTQSAQRFGRSRKCKCLTHTQTTVDSKSLPGASLQVS